MLLFTMMTFSAKAQLFDFSENSYDATVGVNLGVVGYHLGNSQIAKTYADFGCGLSASLVGVYVDFIYQAPEHRWGNKITPDVYHDHTALTINVGYKIPVTSWMNVIPLIGYSNETTGLTDCSTINIDYDSYSIYHDYDRETIAHHFNYGAGLSFKPIEWLEIGGVCTAHATYGNISVNIMKYKK